MYSENEMKKKRKIQFEIEKNAEIEEYPKQV